MTDDAEREGLRERLDNLGRRIGEERQRLAQLGSPDNELEQDWEHVVKGHAALRNRIAAPQQGAATPATLHADVHNLERDFERWGRRLHELIAGRARRSR